MKIDRLVMQAFGPFAGTEALDFRELHGQALVLINGQTGAGKTTILDAVCYALFGNSSGKSRAGKDMRCDHAKRDTLTEVILDFRLGAKAYRVHRIPEQMRPAKRRDGEVEQKHKVTLHDRSALGEDDIASEGKLLRSGDTKVGAHLRELLAFDEEQFRHVVMLPQGQFRKFLEADSKKREEVLQALFSTKYYWQIADELAKRKNKLKKQVEAAGNKAAGLLESAGVEDAEAFEALVESLKHAHAKLEGEQPALAAAHAKARAALDKAKADAALLAEVDEAKVAKASVEREAEAIASVRKRVEAAHKAKGLDERRAHARARRAEAEAAEAKLAAAAKASQAAEEEAVAAAAARETLDARSGELDELRAALAKLEHMSEPVRELRRWTATVAQHEAARAACETTSQARTKARDAAASTVTTLEAALATLQGQADAFDAARAAHEELVARQEQHQKLLEARKGVERARSARDQLSTKLDRAKAAVLDARLQHEACDARWREAQAGVLAQGLEDGHPCPVCGSREHPTPAASSDDHAGDAELEQAKVALDDASRTLDEVQARHGEAEVRLASEQSKSAALAETLGELAQLDADTLATRVADAQRERELAKRKRDELAGHQTSLDAAREALAASEKGLAEAQAAQQDANDQLLQARAKLESREADVPEALRAEGALERATTDKREAVRTLSASIEAARERDAKAKSARAEARTAHEALRQTATAARERALAAEAALIEGRKAAGLDEAGPWEQALADLAELDALVARVRDHEGRSRAAGERLQRAETAAQDVEPPELEALRDADAKATAAHEAGLKAVASAKEQFESAKKLFDDYQRRVGETAALIRDHELVASVAGLADGTSPPKISFPRFVLAAYLERVLDNASVRLEEMSEGRYTLRRKAAAEHKSARAGLDLEVMDAYTGKARPVSTLSGGEGFLTSLALSLGLADVATHESGGIHLDTLFVDEGFGTLDPQALDKAIDILTRLNEGGRLVAIISHVPELKQRIGARIDVLKGAEGSRTQIILP